MSRQAEVSSTPSIGSSLALTVLVPFGLGYFLSYLYRTVNAVLGPELATALNLDPGALGLLTSAYFIGFASVQIPLGMALDRWGPRRVESVLLLVAATGALIFSMAETTLILALGRGLIGIGVSSCLMAAIKANVQWFPPQRLALANGIVLACGGLGAVTATAPVQALLEVTDWRGVFLALVGVTLAASALIAFVVPEKASGRSGESWASAFRGALGVFVHPIFLRVAPMSVLGQAIFLAYHGLWAIAWMREVDALGPASASQVLALATVGMIVGNLGLGLVADRLGRRGISTLAVALGGSSLFILAQLALVLRVPLPQVVLWGAFSLFGTGGTLYFAALSQLFPGAIAGRVNTAANMLVFIMAFALQWLIGVTLGELPEHGVPLPAAHRIQMGVLVALEIAALAWVLSGWRRGVIPSRAGVQPAGSPARK